MKGIKNWIFLVHFLLNFKWVYLAPVANTTFVKLFIGLLIKGSWICPRPFLVHKAISFNILSPKMLSKVQLLPKTKSYIHHWLQLGRFVHQALRTHPSYQNRREMSLGPLVSTVPLAFGNTFLFILRLCTWEFEANSPCDHSCTLRAAESLICYIIQSRGRDYEARG